ncbi:uncharacterized protein M6B38_284045 [Iris pallida]|uniref:Pentatricopeptide repeat-containing protein n=1 Tax=Iris pallida TaxID=29817 RepID=A0AAX6I185_IRIPA|nr:uncharacterized protein M6B38_284045 [Iris pallida]
MASSTSSFLAPLPPLLPAPPPPPHRNPKPVTTITCGPRDNRGPILRGRTLSTEAILAVQSLKRSAAAAASADPTALLSRLLKPDLLAVLAELQRQGRPALALRVLSAARGEPWYRPDCSLFAAMVKSLHRKEMGAEIDALVRDAAAELEREGGIGGNDLRGPARLVKALTEAGRTDGVRMVYGMMKRGGCVPDEYLFKFMIRGLRRLGDDDGAEEVERDYHVWCEGGPVPPPPDATTVL